MKTTTESQRVDQDPKLCIVGDLLIDSTHYVDVTKLSPEAPVPVAMLTGDMIETPGGAGLGAALAAKDGIPLVFCTCTSLPRMEWMLNEYRVPTIIGMAGEYGRTNCIKTRYIDTETHYHLLRVDSDYIINKPLPTPELENFWMNQVEECLSTKSVKVLALLDYRKGLLTEARSQRLINMARKVDIPIYVDSRCVNLNQFRNVDILKLNKEEFDRAQYMFGVAGSDDLAAQEIMEALRLKHLIVTLGADGADLYSAHSPDMHAHVDAPVHEGSPDVTGCGDVFDVTFCYHWGIKELPREAALRAAVNRATQFAHEPIGERLKWQS
jgi:bifunctional ADP-heptose synthase (sugar kinase/adenylyltransferase)